MKQIAVRIGGFVVNAGSQTIADEMRNFFAERNYPNYVVTDALSSIAYGAPPVTSFTLAKQDEGWEIVSANIFWM